jgi:hypothetical protein
MRCLWLLPLLLLSGCYYPYGPAYGYGGYPYPSYPSYGYAPSYYGSSPPPPSYSNQPSYPGAQQPYYGYAQPGYGGPAANDPNNCGTPDEPRPCYGRYR